MMAPFGVRPEYERAGAEPTWGIGLFYAVIPGRREATNPESRDSGFALRAPRNDTACQVAIGVGMVRNARVTCQNNCRLMASATEWAVPGRMMNWRSPFGS